MSQTLAKPFLITFSLLTLCHSVSVTLNMASSYSFLHSIVKAEVVNFQGTEFVYILFSNGTISKLNSMLQYQASIVTVDGENITDFQVCNTQFYSQNTPSLMVTVQSQNKWKLISLIDHKLQYNLYYFVGVKKVLCVGAYYPDNSNHPSFRGTVYYQDMMAHIELQSGMQSLLYYLNYTCNTDSQRQYFKKVVQVNYQNRTYQVSVTEKGDRVATFEPLAKTLFTTYSSWISSSGLKHFHIDGESVFFLQTMGPDLDISYFMNYSNKVIFYSSLTPKEIKAIRPKYESDGNRYFFYNHSLALANLSQKNYIFNNNSAQSLSFSDDTQLGFAVFSSGTNSFAYEVNTPTIYSYCESMIVGACLSTIKLPSTRSVSFCAQYDVNSTLCTKCQDTFFLDNNKCFQIVNNCSVIYCTQCFTNGTCLSCDSSHQINSLGISCDALPTEAIPVNNNNTNVQNNTIIINPSRNPITQNKTNEVIINSTNQSQSTRSQIFFSKDLINDRMVSFDPSIQTMAGASTKMNSSPMFRVLLTFLSPLFGMFDDYWFYIYHQNSWENLSLFPDLMIIMYTVNQQRVVPDYLRFTNEIKLDCLSGSNNFQKFTSQSIMQIDEQIIYTGLNFQQILLRQFPFSIFVLFLIKLITLFIYKIRRQSKIQNDKQTIKNSNTLKKTQQSSTNQIKVSKAKILLNYLTQFFEDMLSFKSIILTFFGSNIIIVSFHLSSQLRSFFAFNFFDTINMVLTIIFVIAFLFSFVILIALSESLFPSIKIAKDQERQVLKAKKQKMKKLKYDDMNIMIYSGIKCILYGFIHGYFIDQNLLQYIFLIVTKIFLIGVLFRYPKLFQHTPLRISNFLYYFSGILIDTLYLVSKVQLIPQILLQTVVSSYSSINLIETTLLFLLTGSIFGGVIFQLGQGIKSLFCKKDETKKVNFQVRKQSMISVQNKVSPLIQDSFKSLKNGIYNLSRKDYDHNFNQMEINELKQVFTKDKSKVKSKLIKQKAKNFLTFTSIVSKHKSSQADFEKFNVNYAKNKLGSQTKQDKCDNKFVFDKKITNASQLQNAQMGQHPKQQDKKRKFKFKEMKQIVSTNKIRADMKINFNMTFLNVKSTNKSKQQTQLSIE